MFFTAFWPGLCLARSWLMIQADTLKFLREIKKNNNREWFLANKSRYQAAQEDLADFVSRLIVAIAKFDPSVARLRVQDCLFRIYRDVRFARDKSPYKTHLGAYISTAPKKSMIHSTAGYYIHIEPGASMLAGGAYEPPTPWLTRIRAAIAKDAKAYRKIIEAKSFREQFGALEGEVLKRPPAGYAADHPAIELLKMKSHLAVHKLTDADLLSKDFLKRAGSVFKAMAPLNLFLNKQSPTS